MLKRFELHNHTTESDASITCAELVDIRSPMARRLRAAAGLR